MKANLTTDLAKLANKDIAFARRNGELIVTQTKRGNVTLAFDGTAYALSGATVNWKTGDVDSWEIKGPKQVIAKALTELYVVEVAA